MRALANAHPTIEVRTEARAERTGSSLSGLFTRIAQAHPGRLAVSDQTRREAWSGRPQVEWTYGWAQKMLERLSTYLATLSLPAGSAVGICLANSSESYLAILAVERAGLTPCLLPLTWSEEALRKAVAATRLQMVITQGVVGEDRPADTFCRIQSHVFRLRYILAFGPELPRGVVDLDRVLMDPWLADEDQDRFRQEPAPDGNLITFSRRGDDPRPIVRKTGSLVATGRSVLATTQTRPGERIVSLLPPDDLAGLATGLASALAAGASLECHGVFGSASLMDSLYDPTPAHLLAPGWMDEALADFELPAPVTPVLVHPVPFRFKPHTMLKPGTVDILAFDEEALLASPRSARGVFNFSLDRGTSEERERPIRTKIAADGSILFSGQSAEIGEYRDGEAIWAQAPGWRPSGFKVERFAGVIIGVT